VNEALFTHRNERYRFELLDSEDSYIQDLDGVTGGQLDYSIYNTIRSGGNLSIVGDDSIDWMSSRVKIFYVLSTESGDLEWPLGVFIPAAPVTSVDGTQKNRNIELYDKLLVLQQDALDVTYLVPAGTVVTDAIRAIIESTGETNIAITDSTETLTESKIWSAGTSKLKAVNELLSAINYFSIWCDGNGQYQAEPYRSPAYRSVVYTFQDDEHGLHLPAFIEDADTFVVPNKVIGVVSSPDTELISVATNTDPDSPFSYANRGNRWIVKVVTGLDATSQDVLDEITYRLLSEATQVANTIELTHAWLPIYLNNVMRVNNTQSGTAGRFTLVKTSCVLTSGSLVKTTLREVLT